MVRTRFGVHQAKREPAMIVHSVTDTSRLGLCIALAFALTLPACGDDALVGEGRDAGGGDVHSNGDSGHPAAGCCLTDDFASVPAGDAAFAMSPAVIIESARGTWGNSLGDSLLVEISGAGK